MDDTDQCIPWYETASIPAMLRHARTTYGSAMRKALDGADFGDVPANGLYVIGAMAMEETGLSLTQIVDQLGMSKQAAGQLVDTLVLRGYLERAVNPGDRRKISITLTPRGYAAAEAQAGGRAAVDAALEAQVGPDTVRAMRRALGALCMIGKAEPNSAPRADTPGLASEES